MKNEVYYRVRLLKTEVINNGQGNQWDVYSGMEERITVKNSYDFEDEERAMRHLNGFLKSRPDTEEWKAVDYGRKMVLANYVHYPDPCSYDRYNAIVEKVDMGEEISDAIKLLRGFGYKVVKVEE